MQSGEKEEGGEGGGGRGGGGGGLSVQKRYVVRRHMQVSG